MTRNEFEKMRVNDVEWMETDNRVLIRDLFHEIKYNQLKPMTVVDYEREAYTFPYGNVRVTFDSKVQSSMRNTDMFNQNLLW